MEKRIYKTIFLANARMIVLTLFILFSLTVYAQDDSSKHLYLNRPDEKWDISHNHLNDYEFLCESNDGKLHRLVAYYLGYSDEGNSDYPAFYRTIDGKDYFRITHIIYDFRSDWWTDYSGEEPKMYRYDEKKQENVLMAPYWFDYREEGEKLYRYNEVKKQDELFMDFGLNVGDVFDRPDGVKLQVVEVGDTLMNEYDGPLKVLWLEGVDDKSVQDKWVECFGSVNTALLLADDIPDYHITNLLFMEKECGLCDIGYNNVGYAVRGLYNEINNNYLRSIRFTVKDLKNSNSNPTATSEDESAWSPKLYYDRNYQYIYYFFYHDSDNVLQYLNIPCGNRGLLMSQTNSSFDAIIDFNFPSGIYSLYDSRWNFVQYVTIGGDADAIGTIKNDASKQGSGLFFDLTGRRLSTAPQHGIYIQDGRKVMK